MRAALLAMLLLLSGCATATLQAPNDSTVGERIAASALAQVGLPYQYGGNGPRVFDCSGLVSFTHAAHGIAVPRATSAQFAAARVVPTSQLMAGDLIFFRFDAGAVSHVGIYVGAGRFVHAPQTGRPVEARLLDDPGYRSQFVRAGRLH